MDIISSVSQENPGWLYLQTSLLRIRMYHIYIFPLSPIIVSVVNPLAPLLHYD